MGRDYLNKHVNENGESLSIFDPQSYVLYKTNTLYAIITMINAETAVSIQTGASATHLTRYRQKDDEHLHGGVLAPSSLQNLALISQLPELFPRCSPN